MRKLIFQNQFLSFPCVYFSHPCCYVKVDLYFFCVKFVLWHLHCVVKNVSLRWWHPSKGLHAWGNFSFKCFQICRIGIVSSLFIIVRIIVGLQAFIKYVCYCNYFKNKVCMEKQPQHTLWRPALFSYDDQCINIISISDHKITLSFRNIFIHLYKYKLFCLIAKFWIFVLNFQTQGDGLRNVDFWDAGRLLEENPHEWD